MEEFCSIKIKLKELFSDRALVQKVMLNPTHLFVCSVKTPNLK